MSDPLSYLHDQLEQWRQEGTYQRLRILQIESAAESRFDGKQVINLASNNYLGLTTHPMAVNVLPGGRLEMKQWSYWDPLETAGAADISSKDAIENTRALMEEAVRIRLISDVPLGIFLSGGLDSSTITALAARQCTEPVKTFSIGFHDSKFYDELPYANLVARTFHTDHHVLEPNPDCAMLLTKVIRHFDEPFGNPTAILEYILTKLMREHVTVALSGDGGDELFGGYPRYAGARLAGYYQHLPRFVTRDSSAGFPR